MVLPYFFLSLEGLSIYPETIMGKPRELQRCQQEPWFSWATKWRPITASLRTFYYGGNNPLLVWASVTWISSYLQPNAFLSVTVTSSRPWVALEPHCTYRDTEFWNWEETSLGHTVESPVYWLTIQYSFCSCYTSWSISFHSGCYRHSQQLLCKLNRRQWRPCPWISPVSYVNSPQATASKPLDPGQLPTSFKKMRWPNVESMLLESVSHESWSRKFTARNLPVTLVV